MKLRSLFFATTVFLLILVSLGPSSFSTTGAATAADSFNIYLPTITTSELPFNPINVVYGVNFINSVDHPADAQQFSNGQLTGADWNRWPLYWNRIETDFAVFDWSAHDPVVQGDIDNGFKTNAILLGTPGFYTTRQSSTVRTENSQPEIGIPLSLADIQSATPQGLYDGVFTDGTDVPGDAKTINPITDGPISSLRLCLVINREGYLPSKTAGRPIKGSPIGKCGMRPITASFGTAV